MRIVKSNLVGPERWSPEKAWKWYRNRPWIVGFNYVPSYATSSTDIWQKEKWNARTIDRELRWAEGLGFNSLRIFLQYIVWKDDPKGFMTRFERFLEIADKHGIQVMPVFFDDCAFGNPPQSDPYLGKQRDLIPGQIAPCWTPSPGRKLALDPGERPMLEKYVREIVKAYGGDDRILLWDLFNEPMNAAQTGTGGFLKEINRWARAEKPSQPISTGVWGDELASELNRVMVETSDVVSFHVYADRAGLYRRIREMKSAGYPVICTEWMARLLGSSYADDLPLLKEEGVGCFNWGLVNGGMQCQYPWWNPVGGPEPERWFHDLFHSDGRPYDGAEHAVIRTLTVDKKINWRAGDFTKMRTTPGLLAHVENRISYSDGWERYEGDGPRGGMLHFSATPGATVTRTLPYPAAAAHVVFKAGPDCGIAKVYVDGMPAPIAEIDLYAPEVDWNRRVVVAEGIPAGFHPVTIEVTGRRNTKSSDYWVQVVEIE